jgi:GNAT superfamily N-acetyltransferase
MAARIEIRSARPSDASQLAKLRYGLRSRPTNIESQEAFLERCSEWMASALEQDNWRCWVAERETTLVGALWLQLIQKIPNPTAEPESIAYITNFFVDESQRGRGLGTSMLNEVLAWCGGEQSNKGKRIAGIILWPTDRSRPLYLRHGFAVPKNLFELEL